MEYILTLLEGIASFISPCMLPMLPIYIAYFTGGKSKKRAFINSLAFVIGFTIIFVLLGVFAGTFGMFIRKYIKLINVIMGIIIVIFGFNYIGIFKIKFLNKSKSIDINKNNLKFLSSILFGMIFAICWTPCVGVYLSSALMFSATYGNIVKSALMLFIFSLGIGIPLVISAVLIDKLESTFDFIKKHYKIINIISGIFLIIVGILIMFGINNILV